MHPFRSPILIAEDDEDDFLLLSEALARILPEVPVVWVRNGEGALDYLERSPLPSLILLDLNMPKKDGRETLREIKSREKLKHIPVVVLTTSNSAEDVAAAYKDGSNTYIRKPPSFEKLIEAMEHCRKYWFETALIPNEN